MNISQALSKEFALSVAQIESVINLIDDGNTIPFIARYRKEATGSLDDQILREIFDRLTYLRGLEKRREAIEKSMEELGVMTDELRSALRASKTLAELEDIYRPYKPKRRTRAMIARERGLEPLATLIFLQQPLDAPLEEVAARFVDAEKDVPTVADALQGARDIIAETISDNADIRRALREWIASI